MPGLPFSTANGPSGKQGMLQVLLRDRLSGQKVIFAGTHLKAKAGEVITFSQISLNIDIDSDALPGLSSTRSHLAGLQTIKNFDCLCRCVQANTAAREVQARQMMERLASAHQAASSSDSNSENSGSAGLSRRNTPVVVLCGDFNDSPSSSACQACTPAWPCFSKPSMPKGVIAGDGLAASLR